MIKLIKNELFKILHKRSTLVFALIALLFLIITNIIYRNFDEVFNDTYYEDIDITEVNNYIDSYDPDVDSLDEYAYNLALLDVYNLSSDYTYDSWQYDAFMTYYLNTDTDYYIELHSDNPDEELLDELSLSLFNMMQAIYTDNWKYFAEEEKRELEATIDSYTTALEGNNLSGNDIREYNKMRWIAREELELIDYRLEQDLAPGDDYLNEAITNISNNLYDMASYLYDEDIDVKYYDSVRKTHYENKYILEEKIDTNDSDTLRSVIMNFFTEYSFLIIVFIIMIAGAIVSDEFSKGTIKSLLIVPHDRSKILLSKYIAVMISLVLFITFLFVAQLLVGGIILGFSSLNIPAVVYNLTDKNIEVLNIFSYFLFNLVANLPQIILLATLAFAVSVILNSTAAAITITFCGMIAADMINGIAYSYNIKLLNYFVTTNWDFTTYLFGGTSIYGVTLGHSILICLTYLVIMLVITFMVFKNKDIKNV